MVPSKKWLELLGIRPRKGSPAAGIHFRADERVPSPGAFSNQGRDWVIIFLCGIVGMPRAVAGTIFGLSSSACQKIVEKWQETGVVGLAPGS